MKKKIQKPFDVEAAKRGAKVETREGRPVRIVCYDVAGTRFPILALVNYTINCKNSEDCFAYNIEGKLESGEIYNGRNDLVIVEEVEYPKFQEGAFIVFNGNVYEVSYVDNANSLYHFQNVKSGLSQKLPIENIDNICNSWNTNDARPGDILIDCYNKPFIFKGYTDKEHPGLPVAYCGITSLDAFAISSINYYWSDEHVRPATSDERNQLFNRLEEEGYEWDTESLTLTKKRWRDNEYKTISGYYTHTDSHIIYSENHSNTKENYNLFATEKQAKSALAMARISQIMVNDERFGGTITDEEWCDNKYKHIILRKGNYLDISIRYSYHFLAFHEKEQADLFLKENEDLIRDYYMMD